MDEIELGLHCDAQKRLIEKLKEACIKTKTQVICTTHSRDIFDCLPSDARFFIENINGKTKLTKGISSDFAFAKLSSNPSYEVDIFVEDEDIRVIILTGAGRAFCAGGDLGYLESLNDDKKRKS